MGMGDTQRPQRGVQGVWQSVPLNTQELCLLIVMTAGAQHRNSKGTENIKKSNLKW